MTDDRQADSAESEPKDFTSETYESQVARAKEIIVGVLREYDVLLVPNDRPDESQDDYGDESFVVVLDEESDLN